jgi:hypothetical protein
VCVCDTHTHTHTHRAARETHKQTHTQAQTHTPEQHSRPAASNEKTNGKQVLSFLVRVLIADQLQGSATEPFEGDGVPGNKLKKKSKKGLKKNVRRKKKIQKKC